MKVMTVISLVTLVGILAFAQQPAAPAPQQQALASPIPDGTVINVELKNDIDTKKARVGDKVRLEATDTVKDKAGKVLVPRKTMFVAMLTEAKQSPDARLSFLVTSATTPSGETFGLTAILVGQIVPLKPLGGAMTMAGGNQAEAAMGDVGAANTALAGVKLKPDPNLGSVLVADRRNFSLDKGTTFDIRQVMPAAAAPAKQ